MTLAHSHRPQLHFSGVAYNATDQEIIDVIHEVCGEEAVGLRWPNRTCLPTKLDTHAHKHLRTHVHMHAHAKDVASFREPLIGICEHEVTKVRKDCDPTS
jgi:hypothetical protein